MFLTTFRQICINRVLSSKPPVKNNWRITGNSRYKNIHGCSCFYGVSGSYLHVPDAGTQGIRG
jgi:hypothetical protein